jgi:hypothetical protein
VEVELSELLKFFRSGTCLSAMNNTTTLFTLANAGTTEMSLHYTSTDCLPYDQVLIDYRTI